MFNLVVLTGRLTADPELRYTANNTPVTSFSIAVNRRYKAGEESQRVCRPEGIVCGGSHLDTVYALPRHDRRDHRKRGHRQSEYVDRQSVLCDPSETADHGSCAGRWCFAGYQCLRPELCPDAL